jgi:hypothetical protein
MVRGQATPPSRAILATIASAVRQFSDDALQELRRRFVAEREHPLLLGVIDIELLRRDGSSGLQGR